MSSIEWVHLDESELMQLILYKTITHENDDVLHLNEFEALDNATIDTCTVKAGNDYRIYYYTHAKFESCSIMVEHDMRAVPLPPHTAWWCIEDDNDLSPEDERSFQHLIDTDTICLDGQLVNLVDFRLSYDQYGQDIYVYDTPECRYFFYRSSWEDALED
ncbi:MAG: hypothetical protein EB127_10800 [Alphaproteobacteria bacterium]|nr:hypothetical protein [Alphaproteobacteria bacterium]